MPGAWRRIGSTRLQRCRVFNVDEVRFEPPGGGPAESFYCIDSPDWINVVPLFPDDDVLLVRQYRFGVLDMTLEIPGGMCNRDEPPLDAARRELREETGYTSERWSYLGAVEPNPAFHDNLCHHWLAEDAERTSEELELDPGEDIVVDTLDLDDVRSRIASGDIRHSLVISALARVIDLRAG